jgi:hypothetical protein
MRDVVFLANSMDARSFPLHKRPTVRASKRRPEPPLVDGDQTLALERLLYWGGIPSGTNPLEFLGGAVAAAELRWPSSPPCQFVTAPGQFALVWITKDDKALARTGRRRRVQPT